MSDRIQFRKGDLCSKTFTILSAEGSAALAGVNLTTATLITMRVCDSAGVLVTTFNNATGVGAIGGITVVTAASGICSLRATTLLTATIADYTAEIDVTFSNGDKLGWPLRSGGFAVSIVGIKQP